MKIKQLIKELQKHDPEMEIVLWADHGQTNMTANSVTKTFIEKNEWGNYMMEPTHPEDVYDKDSFIEVLEIAAG